MLELKNVILAIGLALLAAKSAVAADVDFNRDVRPILAQNCYECHGPDSEHREAGLRFDTENGAKADLDGERALVPGDMEKSMLVVRITSTNARKHMPPAKSDKKLSAGQIETLRQWVKEGAAWGKHWAFTPPKQPAIPIVMDAVWAATPIDSFILARLEKEGLHPSPPADRNTLLRRVTLDLTGLPPTPAEVSAFAADNSADAYEKVVDRLLASPAYGERWARLWLDLARYADTKGYEKDRTRQMWPYRDWLIGALNRDLSFDQFTIEQFAGDLLPGATEDQIVATAFNRNTMTNEEGGVDPEEFRIAAVKDRVDTTVQVWMGLTMGCAKCHSHKYDPITQKEYYQFLAFFNQSQDANRGDESPTLAVFPEGLRQKNEKIDAEIAGLQKELETSTPMLEAAQANWEKGVTPGSWQIAQVQSATSNEGTKLTALADGSILASGSRPSRDTYTVMLKTSLAGITGIRLEALTDKSLGDRGGPGRNPEDPNFVISTFRVQIAQASSPENKSDVKFTGAEADFSQAGWPVAAAIDDRVETGWAVSPELGKPHVAVFRTKEKVNAEGEARLTITIDQEYGNGLLLGHFRISVTADEKPAISSLPPEMVAILARAPEKRDDAEKSKLAAYYRTIAPQLDGVRSKIVALRGEKAKPTLLPIMRDLPADKQRVTHVHNRGSFLDPGDKVTAAVPEAFNPLPAGAAANRLGMAKWLVSRENPLTARVLANRYWAQFFGTGIVETQEDFGTQGQPPSHPELIDWLAVDFMDGGWSMKRLCKTIVMSATYRQSSRVTPELAQRDRFNRLLARGPRVRFDAEMLRDNALAVSGLLSRKIGGPSVMPIQPPGIWASVYSGEKWETSAGEDRHRRGIYTFVKRTSPYPSMLAFDGTSRETCTLRRIVTNTPLQALVTLNDPVYVEAAQALARKMMADGGATPADRVRFGINQVLGRPATALQLTELTALYERRHQWYAGHMTEAGQFATDPVGPLPANMDVTEAAAWTAVCNAILNLDQTLTKE